MARKEFSIGDVLPATTNLQITFIWEPYAYYRYIKSDNNNFDIVYWHDYDLQEVIICGEYMDYYVDSYENLYSIDTSNWSLSKRTISYSDSSGNVFWEEVSQGFSVTFEENGGSTVTDLTEQTALPTPLPTATKAKHVFAGWYYDNLFTQKASAGDELTANVTLYAKWYTPTTWCEDIADAIREKEGSSGNIKHVDFPDRIEALPSPKVEQQKTISPTTSSQDVLPDTNKVLSKVTVNAIPTETKSQQPSLESDNQTIDATSGKFMTSFTITKDTTNHIASNIRSGKTLYGVTGNMQPAKEEETKSVSPNFSSGNVVVTPTSGKVMSQVTINKDTTNHVASNIKKDVTLYGITGSSFIAIELTQAQYDALGTKDPNTYYLING